MKEVALCDMIYYRYELCTHRFRSCVQRGPFRSPPRLRSSQVSRASLEGFPRDCNVSRKIRSRPKVRCVSCELCDGVDLFSQYEKLSVAQWGLYLSLTTHTHASWTMNECVVEAPPLYDGSGVYQDEAANIPGSSDQF